MKKLTVFVLVLIIAMLAVVPAFAAGNAQGPKSTGPGDCNFGVVHAGLARDGKTGSFHIPGEHKGASGFCDGMPHSD